MKMNKVMKVVSKLLKQFWKKSCIIKIKLINYKITRKKELNLNWKKINIMDILILTIQIIIPKVQIEREEKNDNLLNIIYLK